MLANKKLSKNAESFKHVFQSYQSTNKCPEMSFAALAAIQMSRAAADKSKLPQQLPFDMSMIENMSRIPFDLSKLPIDKSRCSSNFSMPPFDMSKLPPNSDSKSDSRINNPQTNCDTLSENPPKFEDLLKNPSALTKLSQSKQIFHPKDECNSNMNDDVKRYIDAKFEQMNTNLLERINLFEQETNRKLDLILQKLESR